MADSAQINANVVTQGVIVTGNVVTGGKGDDGTAGVGIPTGGSTNQYLKKNSGTNYDTGWDSLDKNDVGLGNVDNTSDVNKPISTATQTALDSRVAQGELVFNVRDYGAVGDGRRCQYVAVTNGANTVTCNQALFSGSDVGKLIVILQEYPDAITGTGKAFQGTITAVTNSSNATLSGNATMTLNGGATTFCFIGTDDSAAIQAALTAAKLTLPSYTPNDPNQAIGAGYSEVVLPPTGSQGIYMVASQLTVPTSVRFDAQAMLVNVTSSTTVPFMIFQDYSACKNLITENCYNAGIQSGTTNTDQSHTMFENVTMWHTGNAVGQYAIYAAGYDQRFGHIYLKNGYVGFYCDSGSDLHIDELFAIGCMTGLYLKNTQQAHISNQFCDSCRTTGAIIDANSANIYLRIKAFAASGTTFGLSPVVNIGGVTSGVNKHIVVDIQANNTGAAVLSVANVKEATITFLASNTQQQYGNNNPITTGVAYGSAVDQTVSISGNMSSGITPYTGTKAGVYTYTQGGLINFKNPTLVDTVVAGSGYNATNTNAGTDTIASYASTFVNTGNRLLDSRSTTDTVGRFVVYADGKHEWGSGSASRDANLYRSAGDTLKTDDSLIVGAALTIGTLTGLLKSASGLVSTATANTDYLAPNSPAMTGTPTAPTAAGGTNTTQIATTAFVADALATVEASDVDSVNGYTGTVVLAKSDIGLGNVDNTSDVNKPVSTAQAAADALKVSKTGDTMSGQLVMNMPVATGGFVAAQTDASVNSFAGFAASYANAANRAFDARVTGDTFGRYVLYIDGKQEWGPASSARDTNLYRSAADTLKTDDSLIVGAALTIGTLTGLLKSASGLVSAAVAGTDYYNPGGTDVAVADGGTGASTAAGARTNLGLVIGTDVAPVASPALTGTPTAPTATGGTNTTQLATTAFVTSAIAAFTTFAWSEVTGTSQTAAASNGYILNNAGLVTVTLPATAALGSVIEIVGKGAGGWLLAQPSGVTTYFGNTSTTAGVGGSLASTNRRDSLKLVCITADTEWQVASSVGNLTVV